MTGETLKYAVRVLARAHELRNGLAEKSEAQRGRHTSNPTLVLSHGFPSASHQYARLMDRLSDQLHLLAPDYPGFGCSSAPASSTAGGSFD